MPNWLFFHHRSLWVSVFKPIQVFIFTETGFSHTLNLYTNVIVSDATHTLSFKNVTNGVICQGENYQKLKNKTRSQNKQISLEEMSSIVCTMLHCAVRWNRIQYIIMYIIQWNVHFKRNHKLYLKFNGKKCKLKTNQTTFYFREAKQWWN